MQIQNQDKDKETQDFLKLINHQFNLIHRKLNLFFSLAVNFVCKPKKIFLQNEFIKPINLLVYKVPPFWLK